MKKKIKCNVKKCLLEDRSENISQYIEEELINLIKRLEAMNPDVHSGCLRVMVKRHLDYNSVKIFAELVEQYPEIEEIRA